MPTSRAFAGMTRVLFQPFDIGKWFALGFSAWLAGLFSQGGNNGGNASYSSDSDSDSDSDSGTETTEGGAEAKTEASEVIHDFLEGFLNWAQQHLAIVIGIGVLILVVIAVIIVLLWVSSRGKFMFLDNVVHNRDLVKIPWAQYRDAGNSLFLWQLTWGIFVMLLLLSMTAGLGYLIFTGIQEGGWNGSVIAGSITLGLAMAMVFLITSYIWMMLEDFVIPLMYKNSISTNQAWSCLPADSQECDGFVCPVFPLENFVINRGPDRHFCSRIGNLLYRFCSHGDPLYRCRTSSTRVLCFSDFSARNS